MMKIYLTVLVSMFLLSMYTFAADMNSEDMTIKKDTSTENQGLSPYDYVEMNEGTMMIVQNGVKKVMDTNRVMLNGTVVRTDGSYQLSDGSKKMMKNCERMDINGIVMEGSCQ
ncbi:MAG: DUF6799 domain-containing protein [Endomicrobiales bacterium]